MKLTDIGTSQLKLYYGYDYQATDLITIHQPTVQDIIDIGEDKIFGSISPFTANSTSYRAPLWDAGIDWNEVNDYQLFLILYKTLTPEVTKFVFGGFDFSTLELCFNHETEGVCLCRKDKNGIFNIVVDEAIYYRISFYLREMFNQHPKNEFAKGRLTKESLIQEDKTKKIIEERLGKKNNESFMLPLISALLNHPGFKYKKKELGEVGIYEFMDSVQRLQIYENTRALITGSYSGWIDTSGINKEEFNWLRSLSS